MADTACHAGRRGIYFITCLCVSRSLVGVINSRGFGPNSWRSGLFFLLVGCDEPDTVVTTAANGSIVPAWMIDE
jgi:hypothetical protein